MNDDRSDRWPPILAGRKRGVVRSRLGAGIIDQLLSSHDSCPGALYETAVTFADADRHGQTVGDVRRSDAYVAMEDAIERLELVTTEIWIAAGLSTTERTDITRRGGVS